MNIRLFSFALYLLTFITSTLTVFLPTTNASEESSVSASVLYEQGKYHEAIARWKSQDWLTHPRVLYNIASAYQKLGLLELAQVYYARALTLAKKDSELALRVSLNQGAAEAPDLFSFTKHSASLWPIGAMLIARKIPSSIFYILSIAIMLILFVGIIRNHSLPRKVLLAVGISLVCLGLGIDWLGNQKVLAIHDDVAILKSGPGEQFTNLQSLKGGSLVIGHTHSNGWTQVTSSAGDKGWISDTLLFEI